MPPVTAENDVYAKAAEEILQRTAVKQGFCLDLACGEGRLALSARVVRGTKRRFWRTRRFCSRMSRAMRLLP